MQRPDAQVTAGGLAPVRPLAFADTFGRLHPAEGGTGVVVCEPWGYEALCARRSLRILADRLAGLGYPVLRYDQPGSGDAAGEAGAADSLAPFRETLAAACVALVGETGVKRIVLAGVGLGGALAALHAAGDPQKVAGLVLLAPVVKGRTWLREVQARAAMIGELTGIAPQPDADEALAIAGLPMPQGLADDIRGIDLSTLAVPDRVAVLTLVRDGRPAEAALAEALACRSGGAQGVFAGHDDMMGDPTGAVPPLADFARIEDWLSAVLPAGGRDGDTPLGLGGPARLAGKGFVEEALVFGPADNLYGIWCAPAGTVIEGVHPAIFMSTGGNPQSGWARGTVEAARALARAGVPSLRFDVADIGDSRPVPGGPAVVHYHEGQKRELAAALDLALARASAGGAVVVGACGGAYLAFNGAVDDGRVAHVVALNLQRFLWDPRDDVAEVLRFGHTSARDYGRKMLSTEKWKRVLSGKTSAFGILRSLANRAYRAGERRLAPWLFGLLPFSRLYRRVHANLASLSARGTKVELLFSEGDPGLAQMDVFFGNGWGRLEAYPNVSVAMIAGADHNLTRRDARDVLFAHVLAATHGRAAADRDQAAE